MNDATLKAFGDELSKIAAGATSWLTHWLESGGRDTEKARLRVAYHFSPKAGTERWEKFVKNVSDPSYLSQLSQHPDVDEELLRHAESMHNLSKGKTTGKVYSQRLPGRSYEIKELPDGAFGCTCPDWRFVGSTRPGYECKHIVAFKAGKVKAED